MLRPPALRLSGDVNAQMANGIEESATVAVMVTQRYVTKVCGRGPSGANDNWCARLACAFQPHAGPCRHSCLCCPLSLLTHHLPFPFLGTSLHATYR